MSIEYFSRNKKLISDGELYRAPAKQNSVNLNWWHTQYNSKEQNLGDLLSEVVVDYLCKKNKIDIEKKISKTRHLYAIGSILFFENQDAVVWGTGSLCGLSKNLHNIMHQRLMRKLDVRAVRGPKTRDTLLRLGIKCPAIYADPAILMPLVYKPTNKKNGKILVIPHFSENNNIALNPEYSVLNMITDNWKYSIDKIASSKAVISSSLHGIILAESYGIPAVFLKQNKNMNIFKYEDYYFGTGRNNIPFVNSIEEGMNYNFNSIEIPNVEAQQEELIRTFPLDIWET